ncbi:MAG: CAP domain-containing protein [Bacteroidota bacterium]
MRHLLRIQSAFFFLAILMVQISCTEDFFVLPEEEDIEPVEETTTATTTDLDAFATSALSQVNQLRRQGIRCGSQLQGAAAPLRWNNKLATAAYRHAKDMADKGYFSHQGSNGSKVSDRVTAAGYTWSRVAENIAKGQRDMTTVMRDWKNSPGHCKNIMNPNYKEFGMARVGNVWVQVFATGR